MQAAQTCVFMLCLVCSAACLLQESVPWWPGMLLFVTTSIFRDEYENQNEVLTVSSVSSDGRTVVTRERLQYSHYG